MSALRHELKPTAVMNSSTASQGRNLEASAARELDWNPVKNTSALAAAAVHHWRAGTIHWRICVFIGSVHVAFAVGLLELSSCQWRTMLFAFVLWPIRFVRAIRHAHVTFLSVPQQRERGRG